MYQRWSIFTSLSKASSLSSSRSPPPPGTSDRIRRASLRWNSTSSDVLLGSMASAFAYACVHRLRTPGGTLVSFPISTALPVCSLKGFMRG
jgi:hypothetical protein